LLTIREDLPDGFLDCPAVDLHRILPGPTLVHLPGRRHEPLFVTILLHGNEDTGLQAVQSLLRSHHSTTLPRALSLFIGNVEAARQRVRRLDNQPDYNRVWPGADTGGSVEHGMMQQIVAQMRARNVFASIDVHNNTGINPHYACVNRLDPRFLHLAAMFSRTVVYFHRPLGVQSMALAQLCPSVTVECGKIGDAAVAAHAADYLDACLRLSSLPSRAVAARDVDVFETVATVRVPEARTFSFGVAGVDIEFDVELDHMNFRELEAGTVWGTVNVPEEGLLDVTDDDGRCVYAEHFAVDNGLLHSKKRIMPAMLTLDAQIVRQDCLCYLMRRLPI
jgi:succinylglutamate desuccinylase